MIEALSYEYDLLTDVSWQRLLAVVCTLGLAYCIEGRVGWRMLTTAFLVSQVAEALALCLRAPANVTIWWVIFGFVPYVAIRPELRRIVVRSPKIATTLLPRFVAWIQFRRRPSEGARKNREALRLLRAEGWRPGWTQQTVSDASGQAHTVWAPPQRLPLGMRMHGWLAFLPTVALGGFVAYLFLQLPHWMRPAAEIGIGIGVLSHFGWLPNPLHLIGL